jgi:putative flippase GtrA
MRWGRRHIRFEWRVSRFGRYAAVSVAATAFAQLGLFLAYGVLRWPVAPAVFFSLAVSVGPAYWLSRRYVWPDTANSRVAVGEATGFFVLALIGSVTTIAMVWLAVRVAGAITSNHLTLSLVANAASIAATGAVWVARYVILDRILFASRTFEDPGDSSTSGALPASLPAVTGTRVGQAYD